MSMFQNGVFNVKDGNQTTNSIIHQIYLELSQANANGTLNIATKSVVDASILTGNVGQVFGVEARTVVQGVGAVINGVLAPVHAVLDISNNANTAGANGGYCIVCEDNTDNANTTRGTGAAPTAFIGFGESAAASAGAAPMQFLFDIGFGGANVTSAANGTVVWSTNNTTNATGNLPTSNNGGALRVRVNGAVRYIQLRTGLST